MEGVVHWLSTNNQLSLLFVVNQRIFVRRETPRPGGWLRLDATRYYLASIFDTLLSSQGSDAHQRFAHRARRRGWYPCCPPWRGNCSNLPASLLGRQIRDPLWERPDRSRLDLCGAPTLAPWGAGSNSVSRGHRSGRKSLSGSGISSRDRPAWGWVVTHPLGVRSSLSG